MIQKFDRDIGQGYYNIFQMIGYFLYGELFEYFIYFNIYSPETDTYNYRRMFWITTAFLLGIVLVSLIMVACAAFLFINLI